MSLMPTAPGSIGSVLDNAIRLYRKTLFPCFPLVFIAVVLTTIPSVMLSNMMTPLAEDDPAAVLALFSNPAVWLGYLVIAVVYAVVYGALIAQIDAIAHDQRLSLGTAFGIGIKRAPTMLGVFILFGLLIGVGLVLLIIPGIWLWGRYQLAVLPPIVERAGATESMGISKRLIQGYWWRTSITVFVAFVLLMVVTLIAGIIAGFASAAGSLDGAADAATAASELVAKAQLAGQIIGAIVNLFTMTLLSSVLLAVYYDLKLRKEGADLAQRVGALNPAT